MDYAQQRGLQTPTAPVSELPASVFCDFGLFWARAGPAVSPSRMDTRRPIAGGKGVF